MVALTAHGFRPVLVEIANALINNGCSVTLEYSMIVTDEENESAVSYIEKVLRDENNVGGKFLVADGIKAAAYDVLGGDGCV